MTGHPLLTWEDNVNDVFGQIRDTITDVPDGLWSSLGMVITDSNLARDEAALRAAHDGLRRLYGWMVRHGWENTHPMAVGRVLGHIDHTTWALRRLPR